MPLYEYHCHTCGANFEKMVRFSEQEQAPECPQCKSRDTRKRISLFAGAGSSSASTTFDSGSACSAPRSSGFS